MSQYEFMSRVTKTSKKVSKRTRVTSKATQRPERRSRFLLPLMDFGGAVWYVSIVVFHLDSLLAKALLAHPT